MKTSNFLRLILIIQVLGFFSTRSNIYYINTEDKDPTQKQSNISDLLKQTMRKYKYENYRGTPELIDMRYIDYYEYIEEKLKALDKKLMEKTAILIREDISNGINDKELIENSNNSYNKIQNNLDMLDQFRQN